MEPKALHGRSKLMPGVDFIHAGCRLWRTDQNRSMRRMGRSLRKRRGRYMYLSEGLGRRRDEWSAPHGSSALLDCDVGGVTPEPVGQHVTDLFGCSPQCTFPDNCDAPSCSRELVDSSAISFRIGREFGIPEFGTRLRETEELALRVSMPKTTVHKYYGVPLRKHDIRISGQTFPMKPIAKSASPQECANQ